MCFSTRFHMPNTCLLYVCWALDVFHNPHKCVNVCQLAMNLGPASLPLLFPHYLSCLFICRLQPKLTRLDGLDGRLRSLSAQRAVAVCPTGPLRTLLQNLSNARAAAPLHSTSWWILRQIRIRFYYRCTAPNIDDERETRRPKRTEPRQTEVTERKGIG